MHDRPDLPEQKHFMVVHPLICTKTIIPLRPGKLKIGKVSQKSPRMVGQLQ